jgi:chromosome segregation ATPase
MPDSKPTKNLSPLTQAVLDLDTQFAELTRLGSKINEMDLKSNFDFEHVDRLIHHFAETGNAVSDHIVRLSEELSTARARAEEIAAKVAEQAGRLQERKMKTQDKMVRFHKLGEKVGQLNLSLQELTRINQSPEAVVSVGNRTKISQRLSEVRDLLPSLIDEASALRAEGQSEKIKILEQNAESMRQSLVAVQTKLASLHQAQLI